MHSLAELSVDELHAAFKASIEFMKQDSFKKLLEVHATLKAYARSRINEHSIGGEFTLNTMQSSTLAAFRAGLASRIGTSLSPSFVAASAFYKLLLSRSSKPQF